MFIAFFIIVILMGGFVLLPVRPVVQHIHFCSHCGQGVYGQVQQTIICQCRPVDDRTGAALSAPAGQGDRYPPVAVMSTGSCGRYRQSGARPEVRQP
ncbi:unnamed protein product (plasmid) [Escherichia coli]|nr:unnamed protein product [Escherichia coli]